VFGHDPKALEQLEASEEEPSLCTLIQRWLERTPGLEADGFNFWNQYKEITSRLLKEQLYEAEVSGQLAKRENTSFCILNLHLFENCNCFYGFLNGILLCAKL